MDAVFLKKHIGNCLVTCLAEVAEKRPKDPIEYIGEWLKNYIQDQKYRKQLNEENEELQKAVAEHKKEQERKKLMQEEEEEFKKVENEAKLAEERVKSRQSKSGSKLSTLAE